MRRRLLVSGLVAARFAAGDAARAQTDDPAGPQPELPKEHLVIRTRDGVSHDFNVEMARTPDQQTVGLMFRPSVPAEGGMLFVWQGVQDSSMWMRNTISSLDMVFINADGTIRRVVHDTTPRSLAVISSNGPVRATLELQAGITAKLGIHAGDTVVHPLFKATGAG